VIYLGQEINGVDSLERSFQERIAWLEDKLGCMCDPTNADFTDSLLIRGRIQGEIGGTQRALEAYTKARKETP
jgi:hypothetical protein